MLIRALAVAALMSATGIASTAVPVAAQSEAATISIAELMQATALDEIFTQFGPSIEASPQEQGVPFDAMLAAVWVEAAREVFNADAMHAALEAALQGRFTPADEAVLAVFFRSDFGREITGRERAVIELDPGGQLAAHSEGLALVDAMENDSRRAAQIEEMLTLVNAEIAAAMLGQSVRGMLIGLSVSRQRGDIEVPWEEIDLHLAQIMPDIQADVAATQRAMMVYAYRDLTEADLDRYLEFLRTEAAQKFYAVAAYSIGRIVTDSMTTFGQRLAAKLARVNV